jgi:hypothetical protein
MATTPKLPKNFISGSITNFRNNVINRGGVQLSSRYMVEFYTPYGQFVTYPNEVNLPQRAFVTFDAGQPQSMWGSKRKIPIQNEYDELTMSFVVYQDWAEKQFLEQWMDNIVNVGKYNEQYYEYANTYFNYVGKIYINTFASDCQPGSIPGGGLTSKILIDEAYPLSLLPISMSADGTGFTTFVLNIAYRKYYYLTN